MQAFPTKQGPTSQQPHLAGSHPSRLPKSLHAANVLKRGRSACGTRQSSTRVHVATLQNGPGTVQERNDPQSAHIVPNVSESPGFPSHVWRRVWMPASPTNMLDTAKPNKITLLGKDLVAWFDAPSQSWEVVEDRCPHRFAPLSLGRIVDGQLLCSYHGWRFGKGGECTDIPQLPPGPPKEAACKQKKACASAYPCTVSDGLLFVWMDNSPEGLRASMLHKPYSSTAPSTFDWIMVQNPNDYTYWLEQGMDPSHAPWLHHGIGGFEMNNATEMVSKAAPEVTLEGGFTWWHEGYETRNRGMRASRQFIPPYAIETRYDKQATGAASTQAFTSLVVPVKPGVSRTMFRFATIPNLTGAGTSSQAAEGSGPTQPQSAASQSPPPAAPPPAASSNTQRRGLGSLLFSFMGNVPHYVFMAMELSDQDVMMMHEQEKRIQKAGLNRNDYALLASGADSGVASINRWIRMAGPPGPQWLQPEALHESAKEVPLERLLDRRSRHVDFCATCQKGFQQVTRLCQVVTALAAAASTAAVALLTVMLHTASLNGEWALAAKQSGGPAVVAAVLGAGLAVAAAKLWDFREDRFVSGLKRWKKKGGLSLIQMP
ncbi:hypothetical protein DUNSADRAFT_15763 [Dunaliella salina]|uniref:Rieske domain-containing protein n=1 Tax=Dunaliella salina TaxID=3046 RepID=A0ABQ7H9E1_DUNSA|nr:hypothetical protein DUNSADRAFT_15763 [Dunaliella salina]|eukprot:KAF5843468.1 hypothetical protein DUNSADRAFT_15763 [Dunaliella salina]